jgi:ABC-type bacteriocin/lantibiotic exporter with double-glycine peptidase domain
MIAHRQNTLRICDLILALDEGRLIESRQCTHDVWTKAATT